MMHADKYLVVHLDEKQDRSTNIKTQKTQNPLLLAEETVFLQGLPGDADDVAQKHGYRATQLPHHDSSDHMPLLLIPA